MVPVIRNVENMNFADIEKTISGLGEKVLVVDLISLVFIFIFAYFIFLIFGHRTITY